MSKFCTSCGKELTDGANVCSNCGTPIEGENTAVANTVTVQQTVATPEKGNGMAVAGFVLSLISLFCCGFLSILGLIFSILGLVNAPKVGGKGKGLAIAGIILGGLAILLMILSFLFMPSFNDRINSIINDEWANIENTIDDEWSNLEYDDDYSTGY